jgi:peptide-methionine (R)-S-oxide reductase
MKGERKSIDEWRAILPPLVFHVTQEGGTERPHTGALIDEHRMGTYRCVCCEAVLFLGRGKFPSGCGWPAFHSEAPGASIRRLEDRTYGMRRIEVRCGTCDAHLGHVFNDGPREHGGDRYCINSVCLAFNPEEEEP